MNLINKSQNGSTITIPLGGEMLKVKRKLWKVSDLKLDPTNPRLGYKLRAQKKGMPATDKELHKILWDMDAVKDLFQSIFQNGGLIEDPIISGTGIVAEGNCRTVCLRELQKKYPDENRWKQVYVRVFPDNVTEEQLMVLLGELHVAGKIEWRAFDQAEYVWKMNKVFGKNYDYLASHLRWSRSKLSQKIAAFEETKAYIERKGDPQGINRFSHFEEFMKKKDLRDKHAVEPGFIRQFGDWVLEGKFPDAKDIRVLPEILNNSEALNKLQSSGIREAEAVLYKENPSLVSNLYSTVDQASSVLEKVSMAEITALQNGEKPKLEKFQRLVKAIKKLEEISGVKLYH